MYCMPLLSLNYHKEAQRQGGQRSSSKLDELYDNPRNLWQGRRENGNSQAMEERDSRPPDYSALTVFDTRMSLAGA